jgi:DNA-binding CsgD family transcriptional regulator
LIAAGRAAEVDPLLRDRLGDPVGPVPIEVQRLEGLALSLAGRLDEAARRYEAMDVARLEAEFDVTDPDVVDAAAELALLRVMTGNLAEARELVDWAEASPAPGTAFRQASVSTAKAWLAGVDGAFEVAAAHARAGLAAVAEDHTRAATVGSPTLALGIVLDGSGDSDGALATFRRGESLAHAPRWAPPVFQLGAALTLYRRGEWDDALAEVDAGLVAADEAGLGLGVFWPFAVGTLISTFRGQHARARDWLDQFRHVTAPRALGTEWLAYASAMVDEAEGRPNDAAAALCRLADAITAVGAPALLLNSGADAVRLGLATGRDGAARRIAAELAQLTTRTASPTASAIADWAGALLAGDAAVLDDVADRLAASRRLPESARARHDGAVVAASRGEATEARRLAKQAFVAYEDLGAEQLHLRLRSELRVHGVAMRPRRSAARPSHGWGSLTTSEHTVVDLAAEGLTNTEIAERLFVSRRTVESHLGRVYAKLGLSTRAQLVAAAFSRRSGG